jgi:hypothetical protein
MNVLTSDELTSLLRAVFPGSSSSDRVVILIDFPRTKSADNARWRKRRELASSWQKVLARGHKRNSLPEAVLVGYAAVAVANAELPEECFFVPAGLPNSAEDLPHKGQACSFSDLFRSFSIFLAPTEYSATAPLKNAARQFGFRAATMPGFSPAMIPALRLDYDEVHRRVLLLAERLTSAESAEVLFLVDGGNERSVNFDLRFRQAHASTGRFPDRGTAGNLPSGEAYIVPYEGESGPESRTAGVLPLQLGKEVIFYHISKNRVETVSGAGQEAKSEREHVRLEPAYGNIAELGFGILAAFGLEPIGTDLLDEKLGFHVAFGRSDHFGGSLGAKDFSSPAAVVHLDRIYIPSLQPRITLKRVSLAYGDGSTEMLMQDGRYLIF